MGDIHRTRTTTRRDMVGRALLCVALGLTMGCGPDNDEPRGTTTPTPTDTASATPTDSGETGETGDSGPTTTTTSLVSLGPEVVCADPSARDVQHFDRRSAPGASATLANLIQGGVLVGDVTGDDRHDIVLPFETGPPGLWVIGSDGLFEEKGAEAFPGIELDDAVGGNLVDYDGDGDLDVFFYQWNAPHRLFQNDGAGQFVEVTATAGDLGNSSYRSQSSAWADMDGDGDLDVVVGSYGDEPKAYDDPSMPPADPAELFENLGDGVFRDVSDRLPQAMKDGYQFQTLWMDINGDQLPELFSIHDFGKVRQSMLLINEGGTFVFDEHSGFHPDFEGMGIGVGDLNDDGQPDFVQSSWRTISVLQSSDLTVPGETPLSGTRWIEYGASLGFVPDIGEENLKCYGTKEPASGNQCYGWGTEFVDIDNDMDLDAPMIFGFWSTYDGTRRYQRDGLWIQDNDTFVDRATDARWGFGDTGAGRGLAWGDFNGDGWLDLAKRQLGGSNPLYISRCGTESWARVRLRDVGDNALGIGAAVEIIAGGRTQRRWIMAGGTSMYGSNPPEAHVGLGEAAEYTLRVTWPDGRRETFDGIPAQRVVTIERQD